MQRLEGLKERLKAALQLPACAVQEVASRLGLVDREEREYRAQHEAGHAAVFFLADKPMVRAEISHFRGMTTHYLNTVLDPVVTINAGEVNLSREDERLFAEEHPDRNALMYLAGIASTQDPKHAGFFSHIVSEQLALGRDATWEDIGVPYSYLADRFTQIHSREPQAHEVRILFHRVNDRMKEIFADPKFARAIQVIKEQIKRRELRGGINSKIRQGLVQAGLSEADFAQMQEQLFSIDIEQIIQGFNPDEEHDAHQDGATHHGSHTGHVMHESHSPHGSRDTGHGSHH